MKARLPLLRPLLVPAVLYMGLVLLATTFLDSNPASTWRYPVALAPMIPGVVLAFGVIGAIRKMDELERKIMLESLAISFALTLLLALSLGYLGIAGLATPNPIFFALFMTLAWLAAKIFIQGRYR
jgi:hypothetical protein